MTWNVIYLPDNLQDHRPGIRQGSRSRKLMHVFRGDLTVLGKSWTGIAVCCVLNSGGWFLSQFLLFYLRPLNSLIITLTPWLWTSGASGRSSLSALRGSGPFCTTSSRSPGRSLWLRGQRGAFYLRQRAGFVPLRRQGHQGSPALFKGPRR